MKKILILLICMICAFNIGFMIGCGNNGGETPVTPVTPSTPTPPPAQNETIYYNVYFEGVDYALPIQVVKEGDKATKPTAKAEKNPSGAIAYVFEYWMYEQIEWNFDTVITEDITLTAKFKEVERKLKVSYDEGEVVEYPYNTILERPQDPTKEKTVDTVYTFDCWMNGEEEFDFTKPITDDVYLVSKFSESIRKYDVTINGETTQMDYGSTVTLEDVESQETGKLYVWSIEGVSVYDSITVQNDVVIVGEWIDGYDLSVNTLGAAVQARSEGAQDITGTVKTDGLIFEKGLRYELTGKGGTNSARRHKLLLPKIDYTKYSSVEYTLTISPKLNVGIVGTTDNVDEDSKFLSMVNEGNVVATLRITSISSDLIGIELSDSKSNIKLTITDTEIASGNKSAAIYGISFEESGCYLELSDARCFYEYSPHLENTDGTALVAKDNGDSWTFDTGAIEKSTPWIMELEKLDYSQYESVTYTYSWNGSWTNIGVMSGETPTYIGNSKVNVRTGSIVVKNENGAYSVLITASDMTSDLKVDITDAAIITGEEAVKIVLLMSTAYRQFTVTAPIKVEKSA